jgi:hypothetical protein
MTLRVISSLPVISTSYSPYYVLLYHARTLFYLQTHHALGQSCHPTLILTISLELHHTTLCSLFQFHSALLETRTISLPKSSPLGPLACAVESSNHIFMSNIDSLVVCAIIVATTTISLVSVDWIDSADLTLFFLLSGFRSAIVASLAGASPKKRCASFAVISLFHRLFCSPCLDSLYLTAILPNRRIKLTRAMMPNDSSSTPLPSTRGQICLPYDDLGQLHTPP